jgi:sterol desaturase/sphingolipid hydroxylase (fatty acid hydroxylase superfamily)
VAELILYAIPALVLLLVVELLSFAYYWFHCIHHEMRIFWASHVVHHSSQHYNLSTAPRQTWTPMTALPFWAPLALLGFPPWMILTQQAISLIYQFWIHTERVKKMPAGSSSSSTRPRTTASTTAPTRSTSTATAAAS